MPPFAPAADPAWLDRFPLRQSGFEGAVLRQCPCCLPSCGAACTRAMLRLALPSRWRCRHRRSPKWRARAQPTHRATELYAASAGRRLRRTLERTCTRTPTYTCAQACAPQRNRSAQDRWTATMPVFAGRGLWPHTRRECAYVSGVDHYRPAIFRALLASLLWCLSPACGAAATPPAVPTGIGEWVERRASELAMLYLSQLENALQAHAKVRRPRACVPSCMRHRCDCMPIRRIRRCVRILRPLLSPKRLLHSLFPQLILVSPCRVESTSSPSS
jgi:hypothetical protein